MPKKKDKLPNKILPIKNADKEGWHENGLIINMLNLPHPFRCILAGGVNSGKTTIIKNILLRAHPAFEEVIICHPDIEYTHEYDDIMGDDGENVHLLNSIPAPEEFEGKVKTLVIIDDLEMKNLGKDQKRNLDRLCGYVSTHKHCSVCITSQDFFNIPSICRRTANVFIVWKSCDLDSFSMIAKKAGMTAQNLNTIFTNLMKHPRDSLWIDNTNDTPYPLRRNGFTLIQKKVNKLDNEAGGENNEENFNVIK